MTSYTLAHPLYLDVQMMVSFLAYLEGGVTFEGEETRRSEEVKTRGGKASGRVKFPSITSWLGAELSGDLSIDRKLDEASEFKAARHHTAASLFNYLYAYLAEDSQITILDRPEDVDHIKDSRLVQVSGRYLGNPLSDILTVFTKVLPYFDEPEDEDSSKGGVKKRNPRKSGNPAVRNSANEVSAEDLAAEVMRQAQEQIDKSTRHLMNQMTEDINSSPVHDLLLVTLEGLRVVLTVSSQYYSAEVSEHLRAGDFMVLGKVTRILGDGESINLARRTAMGAIDQHATRDAIMEGAQSLSLDADDADPIINAPAVQVLPMAIFI